MFQPRLICFDLNKTLINENTWQNLNMAMGVSDAEDALLLSWAEDGIINDTLGQNILCEIYRRRGDSSKENILNIVKRYSYADGAKEAVEALKQMGYEIALISGAMDILVEHVAAELGIKYWRASTGFVFDEHNILESITSPNDSGSDKAAQLEALCQELSIAPTDCVAVGDGANDLALFELTQRGVTFEGSKITSSAWAVIKSLKELPDVVSVTR